MEIFGLPSELVALVMGWLLGLLSLPIGDAIRRGYERGRLAKAIKSELMELRYTMALVADNMKSATGTQDDGFLAWLDATVASYTGTDADQPGFLAAVRQLRSKLAGAIPPKHLSAGSGLHLKTYDLPFLTSQVQRISIFSIEFQQQVLQIKAQLEQFNSDMAFLMRQYELTFNPSLDATNRAVIQGNLQSGYAKGGRSAIHIADLIGKVEALAA